MSQSLSEFKRNAAKRTGSRSHSTAQNALIRIGGETIPMSEACRRTGLHSKEIKRRVRAGKL